MESDNISFIAENKSIKYADLVLAVGLIFGLNLLLVYLKKPDAKKDGAFFLEDKLFENGDLTNEKILQKLIKSLTSFKPEIAFSIGVNAIWGYGKSSFLHKFKTDYTKTNPKAIVFWYRVWKNKGVNAIIENFFEELSASLKPYSGELDSEFKGYVDAVLQLPSTEISKLMTLGRDAINGKETLEKHFLAINNTIAKIDRQIIVLLDDMDRLEQEEILNTLKLIRTLSDFNNLIFIVGYDRKYIVETIQKPKENYLDKVFNVEINLLPFDENQITQKLYKEVDNAFPQQITESDDVRLAQSFRILFEKSSKIFPFEINLENLLGENKPCTTHTLSYLDFLETFRDVKRFVNEFKFNVSFLETVSDVIQSEYILLKLLSYRYRYIQDLVLNKIESVLTTAKIDWVNKKITKDRGLNHDILIYDENSKKNLEEILEGKAKQDLEIINAVLCELFIERNLEFYESNQNSISKRYYVDLYIRNNIATGNITISQIQKALDSSTLHLLIKEIGDDPIKKEFTIQNELKYFVFRNPAENKKQFEDIVLSLNMFMSEGIHSDDEKVLGILKEGFNNFYIDDRASFIEMIKEVLSICNIGYLNKILSDIMINEKRKEQKEKYTSGILEYKQNFFSDEELEYLLLSKLKSLIEQDYDANVILEGYHLLVEKITVSQNIIRPLAANKILHDDIEKKFLEYYKTYLFTMITDRADHSEGEFRGYQPNDFLTQIFSSEEAYQELLQNLNESSKLEVFKRDGIDNLLAFLKSITLQSKDQRSKLKRTIATLEKFIEKDYQPLNREEYDKIWNSKNNK